MDEGDAGDQAAPTSGSAQDDKPPSENGEGDEKDGTEAGDAEAGDAEARNAEAVDRPPSYPTYVSSYCLKYVRTFFNEHLDDEWFRRRYSPLELRREAQAERIRGATEARDMIGQARESLARLGEGNTAAVAGGGTFTLASGANASSFTFKASLINWGFAAPISERPVQLVLLAANGSTVWKSGYCTRLR